MADCRKTYKPTVQEEEIPCDAYSSTDCVFLADDLPLPELELTANCSLTELIKRLVEKIEDQEDRIYELERKVANLE